MMLSPGSKADRWVVWIICVVSIPEGKAAEENVEGLI